MKAAKPALALAGLLAAFGISAAAGKIIIKPEDAKGPLAIVYFRADPPRILHGQASVLKWKVKGATTVTLFGDSDSSCLRETEEREMGMVAPEDSVLVCPEETTEYILKADGPDGEVMQSVTVQVVKPGNPLKIPTTFKAISK